jgi:hypothetical protein
VAFAAGGLLANPPRYQNEAPGVVRTSGASNQVDREGGKMELQAYFSILGGFIRLEDDEF